jgi:hypothetical protein
VLISSAEQGDRFFLICSSKLQATNNDEVSVHACVIQLALATTMPDLSRHDFFKKNGKNYTVNLLDEKGKNWTSKLQEVD